MKNFLPLFILNLSLDNCVKCHLVHVLKVTEQYIPVLFLQGFHESLAFYHTLPGIIYFSISKRLNIFIHSSRESSLHLIIFTFFLYLFFFLLVLLSLLLFVLHLSIWHILLKLQVYYEFIQRHNHVSCSAL